MVLLDLLGTGFDLAYTEIPLSDIFLLIGVLVSVGIVYIFRKIFPFNLIWFFLMMVFVYTMLAYIGNKIKSLFK
jgi:multisubunit Na+/H+ antiporter MnhE subunit